MRFVNTLGRIATAAILATSLAACSLLKTETAEPTDLDFQVYNPQASALFPVTSTLITGPNEAILFDAQFQKNDAQQLVNMVLASGKQLTTIYISHGDPDYYFGLDVLTAAFPDAKVVATPATVAKIKKSMQGKKAYWGPILKDNAPQKLVLPQALTGDTLMLDGEEIRIVGFDGHDPLHTFGWVESEKTVVGGVVLVENMHVWMADNQTTESRNHWLTTLDIMAQLKPQRVIAGHFLGETKADTSIIQFTADYIRDFERMNGQSNNAAELT